MCRPETARLEQLHVQQGDFLFPVRLLQPLKRLSLRLLEPPSRLPLQLECPLLLQVLLLLVQNALGDLLLADTFDALLP